MVDISVVLAAPGWRAAVKRPEALARRAAEAALREAGAAGAMTVLLTDDTEVKRLNGQHRAKAKPTNVLSFPADAPGMLGDVALALGVVRREARGAGAGPPRIWRIWWRMARCTWPGTITSRPGRHAGWSVPRRA